MAKSAAYRNEQSGGKHKRFKVGDIVRFQFVNRYEQGRIVEDRGDLAGPNHHIYRVRIESNPVETGSDHWETEILADELTLVD